MIRGEFIKMFQKDILKLKEIIEELKFKINLIEKQINKNKKENEKQKYIFLLFIVLLIILFFCLLNF